MQKTRTCLWFEGRAEEAVNFYVSLIPNSKVTKVERYTEVVSETAKMPVGTELAVEFTLGGVEYMALNGGPVFKQSEAVSIMVRCEDQQEVDDLWAKLTADGGEESMCGWLKDKYGLSWQIIPKAMDEIDQAKNPEGWDRAMAKLMEMRKLDGEVLLQAYRGQ